MASTSNGSKGGWASKQKLDARFPVHTSWEFTLKGEETVQGTIYCTDEASQVVVVQSDLTHTTLATEMRMIQANSIVRSVQKEDGESAAPAASQLPKVQKKALEEREQRALRMAEEMLRHINEKASPKGQVVFDKLVKACGKAAWKGESIVVLNEVQVDPPYGPDQCKPIQRNASGKKADGSLERIKKIVASAS